MLKSLRFRRYNSRGNDLFSSEAPCLKCGIFFRYVLIAPSFFFCALPRISFCIFIAVALQTLSFAPSISKVLRSEDRSFPGFNPAFLMVVGLMKWLMSVLGEGKTLNS